MTFDEILDFVVLHTRHERYRDLCDESCPQWKGYRSIVIDRYYQIMSQPNPEPPPDEPVEWPCMGCPEPMIPTE